MTDTPSAEEIRDRLAAAHLMINDLCHQRRQWMMSIPARPDYDPDLVIGASLMDIPTLISRVAEAEKRAGEAKAKDVAEVVQFLADTPLRQEAATIAVEIAHKILLEDSAGVIAKMILPLLQRAREAERTRIAECTNYASESHDLRHRNGELYALVRENFWIWQGDGGDHLESLTCAVSIRPEALAAIIAERDAALKENAELRNALGVANKLLAAQGEAR